ncbi:MAG: DNA-binding protein [Deltaproteobacteria bacterium CG_4_10_14_0_2_um_filter_43_8]|nr:MAG: DNA-binding protein [Deltaproteobacteria bacterium CG11_big_fil_rev_8_21_14_0_20_42_23]PJA21444.1 MAG: DNA-binding protein [Deltaproteobacteria bacterium CG_4_10_14_0_2_um_filter_43_8]PJC63442.1 MAG: DNA-binding protein [Deltaproteobacteria bacterium CG_4_9_14_0_2_um_filter_42_21]
MTTHQALIATKLIERKIYLFRHHKVMLDADLAKLYGVTTSAFNQAVKRNKKRFPSDFMFQLNDDEVAYLRQTDDPKRGHGKHRKYVPYAFTEQGVAMLSSVLKSERAVQVNIEIMRTFVKLREMISTHKDLVRKINVMEKKYNQQFKMVFDAIRELMTPSSPKKKHPIGFSAEK